MNIKKIDREKIINELKALGYENKLVSYEEFQKLHKEYGNGMDEADFAQEILGIVDNNYKDFKIKRRKATILKSEIIIISEEEKQKIIKEIKSLGYENTLITYEEIQTLHKKYAKGMKEIDFARDILGIPDCNYTNCKIRNHRTRIFQPPIIIISEEEKQKIIKEIKSLGYENTLITHEEIQTLHKKYAEGMKEIDFAREILGIISTNYRNCLYKGIKTRILKLDKEKVSAEEKQEIIEKLKRLGYGNKLITYEELQIICKKYGKDMKEVDFAQQILNVTYFNYQNCKFKKTKIRILKTKKEEVSKEKKQEIIKELKTLGYENKLITLEELQNLYKIYGKNMKEVDFAQQILGISYPSYRDCKIKKQRTKILKTETKKFSEQEKQEIINELKKLGYEDKLITLQELQTLHKKYGIEMKEVEFAQEILNLTYNNYKNCIHKGTKVKILKTQVVPITISNEEIQKIINKLKSLGYQNKTITYEEFQNLHKQYGKGMEEKMFAFEVLGITYSNYKSCKNHKTRIKILKDQFIKISKEEKNNIINKIKETNYYGKLISYEEFQILYKEYGKGIKEVEFAREILGISGSNHNKCKNQKQRTMTRNPIILSKAKEIKSLYINKPNYYSKEYIESICNEYDLTLQDFITYVVNNNVESMCINIDFLQRNDKIWIGKTKLTKEFVNNNIEIIDKIATVVVKIFCTKYGIKDKFDDYKQDIIIYLIENTGFFEKNLGNDIETFIKIIYSYAYKYCEGKILKDFIKSCKNESFIKYTRKNGDNDEFEVQYADKTVNVEREAIEKIDKQITNENNIEMCINLLIKYIENGIDENRAIQLVSEQTNLDKIELLNKIKNYFIDNGYQKKKRI